MSPPKPRIFVKEGAFPSEKDYMSYEKKCRKNMMEIDMVQKARTTI